MPPRPCWPLLALLVACRDPGPPTAAGSPPAATAASASRPVRDVTPPGGLELVEFTTGGAEAGQTLPLVLALHGLGDRPESFGGWLRELPAPARVYALRAPLAWGQGFSWFAPTGRGGGAVDPAALGPGVEQALGLILADLDRLAARRPTRGKPVVTGFSQGGMLSFALAARAPERFAGVFPVAGVLPTSLEPPAPPAALPRFWAFHGDADERVPVDLARASIDRFRARGWATELREYRGVGHTISGDERRALLAAIAGALPGP